jgi:phosphatidylglycerophosphate synthase
MSDGSETNRLSVAEIYRRSIKAEDLRFNRYIARPKAAVLVYLLRGTRITPNQVTLLSLLTSLCGIATLVLCPGRVGLIAAALVLHLAFVLDCVDGQLARIKGLSSPVGAYLDFLVDEIKAVLLVASCAARLAIDGAPTLGALPVSSQVFWLGLGLLGVCIAAAGISTTTFMRRPEYFEAVHGRKGERVAGYTKFKEPTEAAPSSLLKKIVLLPIRIVEALGKLTLHYPAWFFVPAALGHMEWFLLPYLTAHTLYLGRSWLVVVWKLGR